MNDTILIVNSGSSSIKFSLFARTQDKYLILVYRGSISGIGTHPRFVTKNAKGHSLTEQTLPPHSDHEAAFKAILQWLEQQDDDLNLIAIGHRVVHGGVHFTKPVKVDAQVIATLESLIPLAPLHEPHNIAPIKLLQKLKPDLPQVACFDTAFHATQPDIARLFAIPRELTAKGIKRYGFHGLSYEYISQVLPGYVGRLPEKVVVCHLGNGASMAALLNGKSVATTMGLTALDGLPMGTRPGHLDPGVVLHLLNDGMDVQTLEHFLYHQCGLLGVSGISNDMQDLLEKQTPEAQEAIDLFCYQINRELGALAATLGGLDSLVFTAGMGEHAPLIREKVCQQAAWLGIKLDVQANANKQAKLHLPGSRVSVWVIPTNEEKMIAQHTDNLLNH